MEASGTRSPVRYIVVGVALFILSVLILTGTLVISMGLLQGSLSDSHTGIGAGSIVVMGLGVGLSALVGWTGIGLGIFGIIRLARS